LTAADLPVSMDPALLEGGDYRDDDVPERTAERRRS
jgi:hypothetical protein